MNNVQDCDSVFITPYIDNWNPHCDFFKKNDNAMTNFGGELLEDKRNNNDAMGISDGNEMFQNYLYQSRILMITYILPLEAHMHMTQEVCTSNAIKI